MISDIARNFFNRIRDRGLLPTCVTYGHMLRWKWAKRNPNREFLIRRIHGYKMCLSLRQPGISDALNRFGTREPEHLFIVKRAIKEGMCVLDIGGNIGYYTLMAAKLVGPKGKVYSVEPHPDNCRILNKSVKENGFEPIVEVEELAISDQDGTRDFNVAGSSNLHSFHDHSLDPGLKGTDNITDESIPVKTVELETYLENKRQPDLLRMDVEGHEVEILNSIARIAKTSSWRPVILFESHCCYYNSEAHDITRPLKELFQLGYKPRWAASLKEPAEGFKKRGYTPTERVKSVQSELGMYENLTEKDALALIMEPGQMRCILLNPPTAPKAK
jgi:FkbM family methyltransferase